MSNTFRNSVGINLFRIFQNSIIFYFKNKNLYYTRLYPEHFKWWLQSSRSRIGNSQNEKPILFFSLGLSDMKTHGYRSPFMYLWYSFILMIVHIQSRWETKENILLDSRRVFAAFSTLNCSYWLRTWVGIQSPLREREFFLYSLLVGRNGEFPESRWGLVSIERCKIRRRRWNEGGKREESDSKRMNEEKGIQKM